jgi:hypothetical protein
VGERAGVDRRRLDRRSFRCAQERQNGQDEQRLGDNRMETKVNNNHNHGNNRKEKPMNVPRSHG